MRRAFVLVLAFLGVFVTAGSAPARPVATVDLRYEQLGGADGTLGLPLGPEKEGRREFQGGTLTALPGGSVALSFRGPTSYYIVPSGDLAADLRAMSDQGCG